MDALVLGLILLLFALTELLAAGCSRLEPKR